jgi:hypothetical protein
MRTSVWAIRDHSSLEKVVFKPLTNVAMVRAELVNHTRDPIDQY